MTYIYVPHNHCTNTNKVFSDMYVLWSPRKVQLNWVPFISNLNLLVINTKLFDYQNILFKQNGNILTFKQNQLLSSVIVFFLHLIHTIKNSGYTVIGYLSYIYTC